MFPPPHSKSVTKLVLCLDLAKNNFHQILLSFFKMNDTVSFEDNLFVHFQWLSKQNFPFKVCNTDFIIPNTTIFYNYNMCVAG